MKQVLTGGSSSYYSVEVTNGRGQRYVAECIDLLEAVDFTYSELNVIKAIWRSAAARTLNISKIGLTAKYDAEKILFFCSRIVSRAGSRKIRPRYAQLTGIKVDFPENPDQPPYSFNLEDLAEALDMNNQEILILQTIITVATRRTSITYDAYTQPEARDLDALSEYLHAKAVIDGRQ